MKAKHRQYQALPVNTILIQFSPVYILTTHLLKLLIAQSIRL